MTAVLLQLPNRDLRNIPFTLRALAEAVEQGKYDDAHSLAWVIDCGAGRVECGLIGSSLNPGAEAHLLFAIAQRRLEKL